MTKFYAYFLIGLVFLAVILARSTTSTDEPNLSSSFVVISGQSIAVEVANDALTWTQGLSDRDMLAAGKGMLFIYPDKARRSFWMRNMNFDIDLLWIDDDRIVGWQAYMPAPTPDTPDRNLPRYSSPQPVNMVLEVAAGTIDQLGVKVNDIIKLDL